MRLAALDLGSNSFHLLVAEVRVDGSFSPLVQEKEMLRLGDVVSREGHIPPAAADRAVATVRRFRMLAEASDAREVLACATAAIRRATNGSEVVDRIEAETGVRVEVISGTREAELIFTAVRASVLIEPGPALCLDVGGGSVECSVGDARGLAYATSLPIGVAALSAECVRDDPPSKGDRRRLEARLDEVLSPVVADVAPFAPRMGIGSSGTLTDLARMTVADREGEVPKSVNNLRIHRKDFLALHKRIMGTSAAERRRLPGLDQKRADILPAGSQILATAFERFDLETLTISEWALREGMVLDAIGHHDPDDWSDDPRALRRASVRSLARRCNSTEEHTRHVAKLALRIFDGTRPLHGLGDDDRELLEYGVLLHDIGQHVSREGHHRHAAYLVAHGGLRGFTPDEVAFLAALVRHHRRGDAKGSEPYLAALGPGAQDRVRVLAAILRVADGLDRGRGHEVDDVAADISPHLVLLRVQAHGDPELAIWGARRRSELFERVFDRDLEFTLTRR